MNAKQTTLEGLPVNDIPEPIFDGMMAVKDLLALLRQRTFDGRYKKISPQFKENVGRFGILQPLIILQYGEMLDGYYRIGAGRGRLQAAIDNNFELIPVRVYDGGMVNISQVTLIENTLREDNILAEYEAINELMEESGSSIDDIVHATGMPKGTIRKRLELANLRPELLDALREQKIARSVAEAAAKLNKGEQGKLVELLQADKKVTGSEIHNVKTAAAWKSISMLDDDLFGTPDAAATKTKKRFSVNDAILLDPNGDMLASFTTPEDAKQAMKLLNNFVFQDM